MRSIKFPDMFSTNYTNITGEDEYVKATKQNARLLLLTERGELFSDPYFGVLFKHYLFDQNNYVLRDMVVDVVYTQLVYFIPQIHVERRDIKIVQDREKGKLYCTFSGINQIDYQPNTYNLTLYDTNKENN